MSAELAVGMGAGRSQAAPAALIATIQPPIYTCDTPIGPADQLRGGRSAAQQPSLLRSCSPLDRLPLIPKLRPTWHAARRAPPASGAAGGAAAAATCWTGLSRPLPSCWPPSATPAT